MRVLIALAAPALACLPSLAAPQAACAPRPTILARLADTYGETRQAIGLGSDGAVVELFASDETGSWTITVTLPSGMTCLVAAGEAFERVSEVLPEGEMH